MERRILRCIGIMAFCYVLIGCRDGRREGYSEWTPISEYEDSITFALDKGFTDRIPRRGQLGLLALLRPPYRLSGTPVSLARNLYWSAMLERDDSVGMRYLHEALEILDSVENRYDYMRVRSAILNRDLSQPVKVYAELSDQLDFYREIEDSSMIQQTLNELGRSMWNIGEYDRALGYVEEAYGICRRKNLKSDALSALNNKGIIFQQLGRNDEARKIFRYLVKDTLLRRDAKLNYNFLCNAAYFLDRPAFLDSAAYIFAGENNFIDKYVFTRWLKSVYYQNNPDSVACYAAEMLPLLDSIRSLELQGRILTTAYSDARYKGNKERALYFLEKKLKIEESLQAQVRRKDVTSFAHRQELASYEKMMAAVRSEKRMQVLTMLILMGVGVSLLSFVGWRYILRLRQRHRRARHDADQNAISLVATRLTLEEKTRVMESIEDDISRMEEAGQIETREAVSIKRTIRNSKIQDEDSQGFMEVFEHVHPRFFIEMCRRYPSITEAQLRFASYMVMNLSAKEIARMHNIQPDAVKKRRHRLRGVLGIPPETSLEDFLRRIAENA